MAICLIEINSCNFGSTGNIMLQISECADKSGFNTLRCYPKSRDNLKKSCSNSLLIGNRVSRNLHLMLAKLTGLNGCFSVFSTLVFLARIEKCNPQIIHLHNLHNCYINLPILFFYLKKKKLKVVWTLHDCWAFTGHCPYFSMIGCNKWINGCNHCPQYREYPKSFVDQSHLMWKIKRKVFTNVKDLTIVTPSIWLGDLVKKSFLSDYPVKVINNGIDLSIFHKRRSDFRKKHGISDKQVMVLGVSFAWGKRKGLDVFIQLANILDNKFRIVLVGTDETIDKELPDNICKVHKTNNQIELAEIYSCADVFVNPTREENYPTVNMESIACGTPVITFKTGGSPEIVGEKEGYVVECNDLKGIVTILKDWERMKAAIDCTDSKSKFDRNSKFQEYITLFRQEEYTL